MRKGENHRFFVRFSLIEKASGIDPFNPRGFVLP